jgi:hypothetical protein
VLSNATRTSTPVSETAAAAAHRFLTSLPHWTTDLFHDATDTAIVAVSALKEITPRAARAVLLGTQEILESEPESSAARAALEVAIALFAYHSMEAETITGDNNGVRLAAIAMLQSAQALLTAETADSFQRRAICVLAAHAATAPRAHLAQIGADKTAEWLAFATHGGDGPRGVSTRSGRGARGDTGAATDGVRAYLSEPQGWLVVRAFARLAAVKAEIAASGKVVGGIAHLCAETLSAAADAGHGAMDDDEAGWEDEDDDGNNDNDDDDDDNNDDDDDNGEDEDGDDNSDDDGDDDGMMADYAELALRLQRGESLGLDDCGSDCSDDEDVDMINYGVLGDDDAKFEFAQFWRSSHGEAAHPGVVPQQVADVIAKI